MNNNDLEIKTELDTVYIDSNGKRHLEYIQALWAETQIQRCINRKLQQKKRIMDIVELIMQVLKSEHWGVFYKNQPIQPLELQGGDALYKVNQVGESEIEEALHNTLTKGTSWQESSQTDSNQNKNSTTG